MASLAKHTNSTKCLAQGCSLRPSFGSILTGQALWCKMHQPPGCVNLMLSRSICLATPACKQQAVYASHGNCLLVRCKDHRRPGDVYFARAGGRAMPPFSTAVSHGAVAHEQLTDELKNKIRVALVLAPAQLCAPAHPYAPFEDYADVPPYAPLEPLQRRAPLPRRVLTGLDALAAASASRGRIRRVAILCNRPRAPRAPVPPLICVIRGGGCLHVCTAYCKQGRCLHVCTAYCKQGRCRHTCRTLCGL